MGLRRFDSPDSSAAIAMRKPYEMRAVVVIGRPSRAAAGAIARSYSATEIMTPPVLAKDMEDAGILKWGPIARPMASPGRGRSVKMGS